MNYSPIYGIDAAKGINSTRYGVLAHVILHITPPFIPVSNTVFCLDTQVKTELSSTR